MEEVRGLTSQNMYNLILSWLEKVLVRNKTLPIGLLYCTNNLHLMFLGLLGSSSEVQFAVPDFLLKIISSHYIQNVLLVTREFRLMFLITLFYL